MDTVESRTEEQPATETVYDGFISYRHARPTPLANAYRHICATCVAGRSRFA
jgi:hypothetical protein